MHNILVVEDSIEYQKIICEVLGDYKTTTVSTAEVAVDLVKSGGFDLVVLDINLPGKNGYFLLTQMQASADLSQIPVLCLTGRTQVTDKVSAFSLGAEDYITKPFDLMEFRARVDSKLRKKAKQNSNALNTTFAELEIDHSRHRVLAGAGKDKIEIPLSQTEFKLLSCLARHPDQVYSRDQLLVATWGEDAKVLDRVVDVHICQLRKKLGNYGHYVKTISGLGYKLSAKANANKKAAI